MAFWSGIMRIALRILNSKLPNYQLVTCQPGESPQLTSILPSQKRQRPGVSGPQLPAQSGSASPPRPSWQSFEISVSGPVGQRFMVSTSQIPVFPNGKEHRNNTNPTTTNIVWFFEDCICFLEKHLHILPHLHNWGLYPFWKVNAKGVSAETPKGSRSWSFNSSPVSCAGNDSFCGPVLQKKLLGVARNYLGRSDLHLDKSFGRDRFQFQYGCFQK